MNSSAMVDPEPTSNDLIPNTECSQDGDEDQSTALIQEAVEAYQAASNTCKCVVGEAKPLQLLDLPADVLREIVKEVGSVTPA